MLRLSQDWGSGGVRPQVAPFPDATDTVNCHVGNTTMRVYGHDGKEIPKDVVAQGEREFNELLQEVVKEAEAEGKGALGEALQRARKRQRQQQAGAERDDQVQNGLHQWGVSRIEG